MTALVLAMLLAAEPSDLIPDPRQRAELRLQDAPTSAAVSCASSAVGFGLGLASVVAGTVLASLQTPRVSVGLTLVGVGGLVGSFAPNLGDLLNGDGRRMATHGLVRLALAAGMGLGTGLASLERPGQSTGVGLLGVVIYSLCALVWLGSGLFDVIDSADAPERWLSRQF